MAFKTFVDAVALPASDLNTYLMKQAVIVCTSGTRPASPNEGMPIYETDTDKLLIYTTATTTWQQPWNLPWGLLGYAQATSNQTGIAALADVTSLTVTFTAVANRRIRLKGYARVLQQTAAGDQVFNISDSANAVQAETFISASLDYRTTHTPEVVISPTSGSKTYKVRATTNAGTAQTLASSVGPAWFLVEDIGPNGSPA